jgi:hypoxanthine phosphoribosyltransferase
MLALAFSTTELFLMPTIRRSHSPRRLPTIIKTAALHHKIVSPIVPDYYGKKILAWRWLIYPWAVIEDLSGLLAAMQPCPATPEEAMRQLESRHGIEAPRRTAEDALAALRLGQFGA